MIRAVSDALVGLITQETPDLADWVVLSSLSKADVDPPKNRLAVALYAVEEHPHLVNRPLVRGSAGYVRAPLSLRLKYLMSYTGDHDEAQQRLARVIEVLHTTPILRSAELGPDLAAKVDSVTLRLTTTTADERHQIWGALGRNARLSLYYDADVAPVEILERDGAGEVLAHQIDYVGTS
ncbi:Pvc16 family protein [uncultured Demequina sp.]|uniref:Pvc16 family protein n=1 Tax=uncultured Demequina sp. TaxID=693499 RepID=UPI0025E9108F|nr:Pvc16 family protein [uncultured Demequina sp.]